MTLVNHCVSGCLYALVVEEIVGKGIGIPVRAIGTNPEDFIYTVQVNNLLHCYKITSDDMVEKATVVLKEYTV